MKPVDFDDLMDTIGKFLSGVIQDGLDFIRPLLAEHYALALEGNLISLCIYLGLMLVIWSPVIIPIVILNRRTRKWVQLVSEYRDQYYAHAKQELFNGAYPIDSRNQKLCMTKDAVRGAMYFDVEGKQIVHISELHWKQFIKEGITPEQALKELALVISFNDIRDITFKDMMQEDVDSIDGVGSFSRLALANALDKSRGLIYIRFITKGDNAEDAYLTMPSRFIDEVECWVESMRNTICQTHISNPFN